MINVFINDMETLPHKVPVYQFLKYICLTMSDKVQYIKQQ